MVKKPITIKNMCTYLKDDTAESDATMLVGIAFGLWGLAVIVTAMPLLGSMPDWRNPPLALVFALVIMLGLAVFFPRYRGD